MATKSPRLIDWFTAYEKASQFFNLDENADNLEELKIYTDEFNGIMSEWVLAAKEDFGELDAEDLPHLSMRRYLGPNMIKVFNKLVSWAQSKVPLS